MEGPGTRDAPRDLAVLIAQQLPVEKKSSRIPRPRQMLSGRGGTTGCFNRPGPILAAGVQVADVQPQSLEKPPALRRWAARTGFHAHLRPIPRR